MQTAQLRHDARGGWSPVLGDPDHCRDAQLVLVFGDRAVLEGPEVLAALRARFPDARIVSCSSGGEILGDEVLEASAVATALRFDDTRVVAVQRELRDASDSFASGETLARELATDELRHVLVFSEGLRVNGSALADGFTSGLPVGVAVTGGLAADGEQFKSTLVGLDGPPTSGRVVAVGLYGARLQVGMGSLGGWETTEAERVVTRSSGNVLLELDGLPALPVYKEMIGAYAYGLPATGLLYPLHVQSADGGPGVVRTLLDIDDQAGSLTFAGDVPEGRHVRLMSANLDRLIDAAGGAATRSLSPLDEAAPQFVLLVSCIGRKLVLQRRTREEVRSARKVFGPDAAFTGFYSYGELSPMTPSARCELHNQTMTITTLAER